MHAIARRAYEKGARYVDVQYFDGAVKRIRARDRARGDARLGAAVARPADGARSASSTPRAVVLVPLVPPGLLDGVDPARAGLDRLPTIKETFKTIDERSIAWTLSPFPTRRLGAAWSTRSSTPSEALERLWRDVVHVCRLDEPDPARAWKERIEQICQVASRLDALDLDALHFEGPGTDLTVGLLPTLALREGRRLVADAHGRAPRAEHPDRGGLHDARPASGPTASSPRRSRSTSRGSLITGLRVRFEGGRAVEIDADANADALRGAAPVDEGASRLGEVALVDRESRIGQLGTHVLHTLLDENAASHLALGDALLVADRRRRPTCRASTRARSTSTS